jgi:hypothetical protein
VARWELRPTLAATFRKFNDYSCHAVLGERHHDWHHAVLRKYLMGLPFLTLAVARRRWWWALPPAAGLAARVARSIVRRREDRGLRWLLNPFQFLGVAAVILTIDAATFLGWARALLLKRGDHRRLLYWEPAPTAGMADSGPV